MASLVRICVFIVFSISSLSLASDYGTTGLIDLPSARMEDDATIKIGAAFDERHRSYMLTYQATPWLEATFRYTGFEQRQPERDTTMNAGLLTQLPHIHRIFPFLESGARCETAIASLVCIAA